MENFDEETPIELISRPWDSLMLNLMEEYWRQFKQFLGNRSFEDVPQLREMIPAVFDAIDPPNLYNYLYP